MKTSIFLAAQAQGGDGGFSMLIMMVAIFAIMWFFMIRPQQRKQKEVRNFQNALTEGTKVITRGGVYGTVKRIDIEKNRVELEIARGVVIEVDRAYIFDDASALQSMQTTKDVR